MTRKNSKTGKILLVPIDVKKGMKTVEELMKKNKKTLELLKY